MSQLMLINPKKRRAHKPRTAAQRAATKRMLASNRARRGGHAPKRRAKRRHNPVGLARVHHGVTRHKRRSVAHRAKRRHNPLRTLGKVGGVGAMAMTSLQGAGGALLVNTALNYVPFLPPMLKSGNGKYIARVGLAVAIGVFGSKVMPSRIANNMAVGAMTVALHDLLLGLASQAMPTLQLGDVGDYDDGVSNEVSAYMSPTAQMNGMGAAYDVFDQGGNVGEYVGQ